MAKILILGGNRFFGKRLAKSLVTEGHDVTLANRGQLNDGLQNQVSRIKVDRDSLESMTSAFRGQTYDLVFDQIAYLDTHAQSAISAFEGKIGRYVFASTMSVYANRGANLSENEYDPYHFDIQKNPHHEIDPADASAFYCRGKQLVEAIIFQQAKFPALAARLSFVLGLDDYTRRLNFHIDRVKQQKPIYFPNPNVKVSMIDSQDAAEALAHLGFSTHTGPFNVCARKPIALKRMIEIIEAKVGKKAVYSTQENDEDWSPYGIENDWYLDPSKLEETGFGARPIESWIPDLII